MTRYITVCILLCSVLASGCGANLASIKSELKVGMSKSEVTQVLGKRGILKKYPRGFQSKGACGHAWSPAEHPATPYMCWICGKQGKPSLETWDLLRTFGPWGIYLEVRFDQSDKLHEWVISDM